MQKILILLIIFIVAGSGFLLFSLKDKKSSPETDLPAPGRWHTPRQAVTATEREEAYQRLIGLGYLDGYVPASGNDGVTVYNRDAAYTGLNFFVSGHAPEAILMDMQGAILHTWRYKNAHDIWQTASGDDPGSYFWRRAHLFENGDILAIYEGIGMIKLDKDSNLVWEYRSPRAPHHDMFILDDGTIYTLTREWTELPHISTGKVLEEFITIMDPEGNIIKEYSFIELIENSAYARMLTNDSYIKAGGFFGHILHTNTIEVFDGTLAHLSPLFKKGNILTSILINHTICIIDLEKKQVVWALGSGMWRHQHEPALLPTGTMLIFDNKDQENESAIKEFDPFSQQIVWKYRGTAHNPFFSRTCGAVQRLPNGNTLITETDNGRAFEVMPDGTIVWEYINPYRGGENKELIASLFEMIRINPEEISREILSADNR